jgi:aryl-alcohol dehydrogenase-like predicted oxidoreductase
MGLGAMGMSGMYGPAERDESIATIHAALDAGINLLDTGDFYGMGHNEMLIGEALSTRNRDEAVISVKFGAQRGPDGAWLGYDARPPGPEGPDRGDDRRHRRDGAGRLRALHRAVGGRLGHDPPRRRRAANRESRSPPTACSHAA